MSVATRYQRIRAELDEECVRLGRKPEEVLLLAVSKTVGLDEVACAIEAGAHAFGENRPDELLRKHEAYPEEQWHFIGNIQSRRIRDIVSAATLIHSVCKEEHLPKIDAAAKEYGKKQRVLLEVNVSGEETKSGFEPGEVWDVCVSALNLENVEVCGLMTMAPRGSEEAIQRTFKGLSELASDINARAEEEDKAIRLSDISMGMTEDWPEAVALGSTIVRVGRAIFSDSFE